MSAAACWRAGHEGDGVFFWESTLGFRECDEGGQQRLSSVLDLLAEAAGRDFDLRGLSHARLRERGQAYLLSRVRVNLLRPFAHAEWLCLRTWENGVAGARFLREYELRDRAGELRIAARSEWLLVDPAGHRPLRPSAAGEVPSGRPVPDCPPCARLPHGCDGLALLGERTVVPSQLDGNGHLYSARYLDLLCDCLPDGGRSVRGLSVNYLRECRAGETLALYGGRTSDGWRMLAQGGGTPRFVAVCE